MNLAIKTSKITFAVFVFSLIFSFLTPMQVFADHDVNHSAKQCTDEGGTWDDNRCNLESEESSTYTGNYIEGDCKGDDIKAGEPEKIDGEQNPNHCGILDIIVVVTNTLSALVGIVVVASIIFGGIQYSSAGSDPQKISAAKDRIRNSIIALLFFIFTYAFLNWLIPGGVL